MRHRSLIVGILALLAVSSATQLLAQRESRRSRSDDDREDRGTWLERCQRQNRRWNEDRSVFCEERTMGWSARSGGSLNVSVSASILLYEARARKSAW